MKQALIDTLEWYAEASPQARLEDAGERANALVLRMNESGDNMLATLLDAAEKVAQNVPDNDQRDVAALRTALMEWED